MKRNLTNEEKEEILNVDEETTDDEGKPSRKSLHESILDEFELIKSGAMHPNNSKILINIHRPDVAWEYLSHILLTSGYFEQLCELIEHYFANIHLPNIKNKTLLETLLNFEPTAKNIKYAIRLLYLGANINNSNEAGKTLLHILKENNYAQEKINELQAWIDEQSKVLHVFSIDADSCLYNSTYSFYLRSQPEKNIGDANNKLIDYLINITSTSNNCWIMNGSNRQTRTRDKNNQIRMNTGSFFTDLPIFTTALSNKKQHQVVLDRYCIADSYSGVESGTTFSGIQPTDVPLDRSKFLLLYSQAERVANQFKNKIVLHFFDNDLDVLNELKNIFEKNPDFLPQNVILKLYRYSGYDDPHCLASIQGQSMIFTEYHAHVITLGKEVEEQNKKIPSDQKYKFNSPWNQTNLAKFKEYRKSLVIKTHSVPRATLFNKWVQKFDNISHPKNSLKNQL